MSAGPLSPQERELLQQLLDDAALLQEQFLVGLPKPSATRAILVPILRRWMVEGLFYSAQKLVLPHQVRFAITSTGTTVKLAKAGVYEHWMGVVTFRDLAITVGKIAEKYLGPDGKPTIHIDHSMPSPLPQKANTFFEQKMFHWKGCFYTRSDVIKMHANALGGVHLDFRRRDDESHINEIKDYFGFEIKPHTNQMLVGKEISEGRADPARRQHIYDATELVAMDTAVIFSAGIRESTENFRALFA